MTKALHKKTDHPQPHSPALLQTKRITAKSSAVRQSDDVWTGTHCKFCRRKQFCAAPIAADPITADPPV